LAVSNLTAEDSAPAPDAAKVTSGSSFYLAMRILPPEQRDAMYQVYAFCRAVDDIADGDLQYTGMPRAERAIALDQWRADIDDCYAGRPRASLMALTKHIDAFHLAREDFHAVIDGMAMDAAGDIVAPDDATLDLYCDRVASAVGRLSVRIFGMQEDAGRQLAHHLGRALQLTNILRDIDEDASIGRVYLPCELLAQEGISTTDILSIVNDARLPRVCLVLADRARVHYEASDAIMAAARRIHTRAPRIMSGAYRCILDANLQRGFDLPRERVRTPRSRLLWIVARNLF
jgi:presqualene diphosphate synthase